MKRFLLIFPVILAAIYYFILASDYFISSAQYTIQSPDDIVMPSAFDSILSGSPSVGGDKDSYAVQQYLLSLDALLRLDKEENFRKHFESKSIDFISRLSLEDSQETALAYYRDRIEVNFEPETGVTTLSVMAVTPEKAQSFNKALLAYGEEMVNRMSERARFDQIEFTRKELTSAEHRLAKARQAILEYQQQGRDMNPVNSATAIATIRHELEGQLASARTELSELEAFHQPGSFKLVALQARIKSLEEQIIQVNQRLVNTDLKGSLSVSIAEFEPLIVEKEFAQQAYASALASLELARVETVKQHRYLTIIANPSLPDASTYPKRLLSVITVLVVTLFFYGIGLLVIVAIKEHAKV